MLNAALMQVPMGLESNHKGIVDLIEKKAYQFVGPNGYIHCLYAYVPSSFKKLTYSF